MTDTYPIESYTRHAAHATIDGQPVFPDEPDLTRHCFVWPERPVTVNVATRAHWRRAAQFTADWRQAFAAMSTGCTPLAWCHVEVQTIHGTNRKMDAAAEALAVKAALDGIVDGGVIPDDQPAYVRSIMFHAPVFLKGQERVIVTLTGPSA